MPLFWNTLAGRSCFGAETAVELRDRIAEGSSVLEVGCGLALPSLVLAKLGLRPTAMDIHPDVPVFLDRNCRENGLETLPCILATGRSGPGLSAGISMLASDVLYDKIQPQTLLNFLDRVVAPGGLRWLRIRAGVIGLAFWTMLGAEVGVCRRKGFYGVNTCELRRV